MFTANYNAAKKAGIKLGAYVYVYSKTADAAKKEADWVLSQIKGKTFELPVYCDMEDKTIAKLPKATLTAITNEFNKKIKAGGFNVGVYANLDWFTNKLDKSVKAAHTWIAHYTSGTNKYRGEYEMWQNSSKGKVDGVKGNVDTNYLYNDIFAKSATTSTSNKTNTSATVAKKSIDEIAKEVLAGKWGNGDERKKKLTNAGYDYAAVQKRVNALTSANSTGTKISYKTTVGKKYRLKKLTTMYEKGNLSGKKYVYLKNTEIEVLGHFSANVDKIKVTRTGRIAHCDVSAFV